MKRTLNQKIALLKEASNKYEANYRILKTSTNPQSRQMADHAKLTADAYNAVIYLLENNSTAQL